MKIGNIGCPVTPRSPYKQTKKALQIRTLVRPHMMRVGNGKFRCKIVPATVSFFPLSLLIVIMRKKHYAKIYMRRCAVIPDLFVLLPAAVSWGGARTVSAWGWLSGFLSRLNLPLFTW